MTRSPDRVPISAFWRDLPREGRLMLSVIAFQFIGTGLVLPFWVVYLHEVRGFGLDTTGLLLAIMPLAGVLCAVPTGWLIDHVGPRKTVVTALAAAAIGQFVMAFADRIWLAVLGMSLVGVSFGMSWPASQSLVASVVPAGIRQRYFGMNFALLNLGIGVGGIIGGFVADVDRPITFTWMYLAESASYLLPLALMLGPLRHIGGRVAHPEGQAPLTGSYAQVLRAPGVKAMTVLSFVAAFVGYAQLNSGMPAYARALSDISTRALGWAFAANTIVIVLLQLVVLQRIEGLRRTRVIVMMSLIWAASWGLLGGSSLVPGGLAAAILVAGCASVFALGETLLQPTVPAIVNDMAPDHLRGRYNAVNSAAFQSANVVGPPVAGFMIGHHLSTAWLASLFLGLIITALVSLRLVEPRITPAANGIIETTRATATD